MKKNYIIKDDDELSKNLWSLRKNLGVLQKSWASEIKISRARIAQIEMGGIITPNEKVLIFDFLNKLENVTIK